MNNITGLDRQLLASLTSLVS